MVLVCISEQSALQIVKNSYVCHAALKRKEKVSVSAAFF